MVFISTTVFKKLIAFVFVFVALIVLARVKEALVWGIPNGFPRIDVALYNGTIILLNLILSYMFGLKPNAKWMVLFLLSFFIGIGLLVVYLQPWLYSHGFKFITITFGKLREFVSIIPVLPVLFLGFQSGYLKR